MEWRIALVLQWNNSKRSDLSSIRTVFLKNRVSVLFALSSLPNLPPAIHADIASQISSKSLSDKQFTVIISKMADLKEDEAENM